MEIKYIRKHNESFMTLIDEARAVEYESKMIDSNDLSILLDHSIFEIDGTTQYNYNISRKENLQDYLETRDYSLESIEKIVLNLQIGLSELEKYLIDENHICLEKDTIFLEKTNSGERLFLCFYPKDNGTIQQQFRAVMEHVISNLQGGDRKKAEHLYAVYDICLKEDYTLEEVLDYLQSNSEEQPEIVVNKIEFDDSFDEDSEEREVEDYFQESSESLYDYYEEKKKKTIGSRLLSLNVLDSVRGLFEKKGESALSKSLKFEDFIIEPDIEIEEKTVLLKDSKPAGKLVYDGRDGAEDDYIITKDIFRIGSSKTNDAILNSKAVSSSHAKIYRENGEYFLEDMNSLNGSYIQGGILNYKEKVKLKTMDVVRFADVSFVFM